MLDAARSVISVGGSFMQKADARGLRQKYDGASSEKKHVHTDCIACKYLFIALILIANDFDVRRTMKGGIVRR